MQIYLLQICFGSDISNTIPVLPVVRFLFYHKYCSLSTYTNPSFSPAANIMMLEADVVIGKVNNTGSDIPIMAHPPANSSDLSLNDFLNEVFEYNSKVNSPQIKKGVKLDFKSIEALDGSVPIIDALYNNMTYPVWINSDIVAGPVNATTIPVNPQSFFTAARNFTNSTLSIGWTTNYSGSDIAIYDNSQIASMLTTIHTNNVSQSITFPVRASIAAHSLSQMQTLLSNVSGSTLTIWSNDDIINVTKLNELIMTVGVNKTYLDLPDNIMKQLDLTGDGSALKPTIMMICALLIATLMLQL
ncbi:menorin (dendritic branching protein) [Holotrichia oblita]|uniref:Menorin (Dendritic branching protein) n=1 Tax=Holotrichia oblita TaxID=644536 RepID=A0ACB9T9P8_HOLOL|nr:menorin (dendritic branching protein) [Holotrichia oblita]